VDRVVVGDDDPVEAGLGGAAEHRVDRRDGVVGGGRVDVRVDPERVPVGRSVHQPPYSSIRQSPTATSPSTAARACVPSVLYAL